MPGLRELQAGFCQSMAGEVPAELLQLIAGDGFDPAARLGIYRNNVMTRLTDTLNAVYPVVCELVDERFFAYAATEFVRQHLPASGCLSGYGAQFPDFLAGFTPAADLHYLADVARLEWAVHEIRQAAVLPPLPIAALAAMRGDPAAIKLRFKPAVKYLASAFAVDQIWIAHQPGSRRDGFQLDGAGVRLQIEATDVLRIVPLAPSIWEFRARLAEGASLGSAVAQAFAISAGFDATSALAALFADELAVDLSQGDDK